MNRARWLTLAILALLSGVAALLVLLRGAAPAPRPQRAVSATAELELAIVAPAGGPAAGAQVSTDRADLPARSADAKGVLRFAKLAKGRLRIAVSLPGAARLQREIALVPGPNRVGLTLVPAVHLAGVVRDDTGAAIAGAAVEAQPEPGWTVPHAALSNAQGRFEFDDLSPGTHALRARAEHHEPAVLPAVSAPSAEPLELVLERTSALRGVVVDAGGQPAADAIVTIAGSGVWPPRDLRADARGAFELRPVPAGVYELRARRAGDVSRPAEGVQVAPAAATHVSLRLEPGHTLRGRIFDAATGSALISIRVRVIEDALSGANLTGQSGGDGTFALVGLRAAPHRVWIAAPGYVAITGQTVDPVASSREPIAFGLRRAAVLRGQVIDEQNAPLGGVELEVTGTSDTGEPILVLPELEDPRAAIALTPPAGDNLGVIAGDVPKIPLIARGDAAVDSAGDLQSGFRTDAEGRFVIEGVPPGRIEIVARKAGYAPLRSPTQLVRAGEARALQPLVLARGAELIGRLVDPGGYAVAGVLVQLEATGERAALTTLTGDDGRFRFEGLRGTCWVTAHPPLTPPVREQVDLAPGERRELLLTLAGSGRPLRGRVLDPRGFPVESASVRVRALDKRTPVSRTAVSRPDGTFQLDALPDPPYALEVSHPDYADTRLEPVSPKLDDELRLELRPGARLYGLVLDHIRNAGIAGARVQLRGPGGARTARTDDTGKFEFRNISLGNYELYAEADDRIGRRSTVRVTLAEPRELDPIALSPGGRISGDVVDRLGSPVFDAEVAVGDPPSWRGASRTDHRGHFSMAGVEPGEQRLWARHRDAGETQGPVPVRVYPLQESPGVVIRLPGQLARE